MSVSTLMKLVPLISSLMSSAPDIIKEIEALVSAVKAGGQPVPATPALDAVKAALPKA